VKDSNETVLGVVEMPGAVCNGVVVSVSEEELAKYDKRETPSEYKRVELSAKDIELLNGQNPIGTFWTYIAVNPKEPDAEHPIPQSYIDVVLNGFLDFGIDFAKEFIDSTDGWKYVADDRNNPNASKNIERRTEIDALLHYGVQEAS
jgi:hypothetical protein